MKYGGRACLQATIDCRAEMAINLASRPLINIELRALMDRLLWIGEFKLRKYLMVTEIVTVLTMWFVRLTGGKNSSVKVTPAFN